MAINQAVSAPPKKPGPTPKPPTSSLAPDKVREAREEALNNGWSAIAAGLMMGGLWADAGAVSTHGPAISREAAAISLKYEKVGNAIDALANVAPFANLFAAVMPLILQVGANHKMLPASAIPGLKDPRVLESQMRVEIQRQQVEFEKAARAEEAALREELAKLNADVSEE